MGPVSGGLQALTLRRKASVGVGYSGTPWSGQAINWNCRTSLFSLEPFCWSTHEPMFEVVKDDMTGSVKLPDVCD